MLLLPEAMSAQSPIDVRNDTGAYEANQSRSVPVIPPDQLRGGSMRRRAPIDPRLARFDSATRLLIETELRDARPEEREHWLAVLVNVDADQVSHLLSARRRVALQADGTPGRLLPRQESATGHASVSTSDLFRQRREMVLGDVGTREPTEREVDRKIDETTGEKGFLRQTLSRSVAPLTRFRGRESKEEDLQAPNSPVQLSRRILDDPEPPVAYRQDASVTTASLDESPPEPRPSSLAPNREQSAYLLGEFSKLIKVLETEASKSGGALSAQSLDQVRLRHVQLRMLYLMSGEPERAMTAIPGLPPDEQEYWINLFWALGREIYPDEDRDIGERRATTASILASAQRHLEERAPLKVTTACFCHKISSFGNYERFARDEFHAGQQVLLYAELKNFRSRLSNDGLFRTRLRSRMEIVPATETSGTPVESRDLGVTEDSCRSQRSDYFHSYRIDIPAGLPSGQYHLQLTIVDEIGGKSVEGSIPFRVR